MPVPLDYGRRTGVTTLRKVAKSLCGLYDAFRPAIDNWVRERMSPEDRDVVLGWLGLLTTVCLILGNTPDD